jgi:hypothetical protein
VEIVAEIAAEIVMDAAGIVEAATVAEIVVDAAAMVDVIANSVYCCDVAAMQPLIAVLSAKRKTPEALSGSGVLTFPPFSCISSHSTFILCVFLQ